MVASASSPSDQGDTVEDLQELDIYEGVLNIRESGETWLWDISISGVPMVRFGEVGSEEEAIDAADAALAEYAGYLHPSRLDLV